MVKLSERLHKIASKVPAGSRIADIGSDHALLPTYLVQSGIVPFAVAGEVNPGPFEAAVNQVEQANLSEAIQVRRGDGLAVITPGEVDTITIAGMGGSLMVHILSADPQKLQGVKRLVLQPNVGEDQVRRWLLEQDWVITDEEILEEDSKIYEIITAVITDDGAGKNRELYDKHRNLSCGKRISMELAMEMGPYLLQKADKTFIKKWKLEIGKLERVVASIEQSGQEASARKAEEFTKKIQDYKEVLDCLLKVKP